VPITIPFNQPFSVPKAVPVNVPQPYTIGSPVVVGTNNNVPTGGGGGGGGGDGGFGGGEFNFHSNPWFSKFATHNFSIQTHFHLLFCFERDEVKYIFIIFAPSIKIFTLKWVEFTVWLYNLRFN